MGTDLNDIAMLKGPAAVKAAMANAKPVDDKPFDPEASRAAEKPRRRTAAARKKDAGPAAIDDGLKKLTSAQWDILRRCSQFDENDVDNGKRLLAWFGDQIVAVNEAGWLGWTGTHWDAETGPLQVDRCAHQVGPLIKREAGLIEPTADEAKIIARADELRGEDDPSSSEAKAAQRTLREIATRRKSRYQFGVRSGDRARIKAMVEMAAPHRTVLPRQMDAEDLALNTANGTLRFQRELDPDCPDPETKRYKVTHRLDPHRPEDLITKVTAAKYDPTAKAENFRRDLARFMTDPATREFLQVFVGYSALGVTGEQVYAFLYGDGSNWKSAFLQAIGRALGTFTKPMNYASISGQNAPSGDKPSPDWARLPGVRFLTIEEVPKNEPLREELIKLITSGSEMPVRHLNKGLFDMRPTFTALMTSNGEPNIRGADHGIWRRTLIVQWEVTIPEEERLPFDQVMAVYEAERDGILQWIVEGIEKYLEVGLKPFITSKMRAFAESVRRDRDAVGSFVDDCVLEAPEGEFVAARALYNAFKRWCGANGVDPVPTETAFGMKIKRVPLNGVPMEKRKKTYEGIKRYNQIKLHNLPMSEDVMGVFSPATPT